tara:strand:+ start:254 stop:1111 length:858 start_codon:yes stop_codon:yes gene_type:complete
MANQNKTILKTYFQQGDIPTEGQYVDLIDSQLNIAETTAQTVAGAVTFTSAITCSGDISSSGTVIADNFQSTGGDDQISFTDSLSITGNITASGNISASGEIFSQTSASFATLINTNKAAQEASSSKWQTLTTAEVDQLENINSETISTAQWSYLGALDQSLTTTSAVRHNQLTLNKINATEDVLSAGEETAGALDTAGTQTSWTMTVRQLPTLPASLSPKYTESTKIEHIGVTANSVIMCNARNHHFHVVTNPLSTDGSFSFSIANVGSINFTATSASFNCVAF